MCRKRRSPIFFFNDTATTEIYTLSLHDALPICDDDQKIDHEFQREIRIEPENFRTQCAAETGEPAAEREGESEYLRHRSEEHTSELQSPDHFVSRLLLEKKTVFAGDRRVVVAHG